MVFSRELKGAASHPPMVGPLLPGEEEKI